VIIRWKSHNDFNVILYVLRKIDEREIIKR
jgi:hypothetical protein